MRQDFPDRKRTRHFQLQTQINQLKARLRRKGELDRKADAHRKIKLGGLVIKAGLADTDNELLFGLLIDGYARADKDINEAQRLRSLGIAAFAQELAIELAS